MKTSVHSVLCVVSIQPLNFTDLSSILFGRVLQTTHTIACAIMLHAYTVQWPGAPVYAVRLHW